MPKLSEIESGMKANIIHISGDRRYLSRITSIGINIGCTVDVIQNIKGLPILIFVKDTLIALNRTECHKIIAEVEK